MGMWLAGFQLVALNYQNTDMSNIVNEGLFLHENGGAGYVLKPQSVCPRGEGRKIDIKRDHSSMSIASEGTKPTQSSPKHGEQEDEVDPSATISTSHSEDK